MKPAKKIPWDSAFFMERATPEWKQAPQVEGSGLPRFKKQPFDFEACREAWAAAKVKKEIREKDVRGHMAMLEKWRLDTNQGLSSRRDQRRAQEGKRRK